MLNWYLLMVLHFRVASEEIGKKLFCFCFSHIMETIFETSDMQYL